MTNVTKDFDRILQSIKDNPIKDISVAFDKVIELLKIQNIQKLDYKEFEIFNSKIELLKSIEIASDGSYVDKNNGKKYVAYIHDFRSYETNYRGNQPKYHWDNNCDRISIASRYVFSQETSGDFLGDGGTRRLKLNLCRNCATRYRELYGKVFNLEEFINNTSNPR